MSICNSIKGRKSCRAYVNKPVNLEIVRNILEVARWAPSGVNHQPAKVAVLGPDKRAELSSKLMDQFSSGTLPNPDYEHCPKTWSDPYKERRKACGLALYNSLGISTDDLQRKKEHWCKNYHFFHAPIGLIVFIDKDMPKGSWIDVGMFIQNILLAASEFGLASCPQAAFADYPDIVRETLDLHDVDIICGIALGYEDALHPLNSYRTDRQAVDGFTHWYN